MELVYGIDLYDQIAAKKERGGVDENSARNIFYQLCVALDYLHNTLGVIHRDVKPENVGFYIGVLFWIYVCSRIISIRTDISFLSVDVSSNI
jgi:hypothetical protein